MSDSSCPPRLSDQIRSNRMQRRWTPARSFVERGPNAALKTELCPACGLHDHVERVSSVVYNNSGSVMLGGAAYPYMSKLAEMLALPEPPKVPPAESVLKKVFWSWLAATVG